MTWDYTKAGTRSGQLRLYVSKYTKAGAGLVDATQFRGAPTQFDQLSSSDPFGDSTAQITFPSITPFDSLDSGEVGKWLGYYSQIDIWWYWSLFDDGGYPNQGYSPRIDPFTNRADHITPNLTHDGAPNRIKVWEGFVAAVEFSDVGCQISCQGALFQLDRYLQKPFYPPQPWPLESLIQQSFSRKLRPQIRTQNLITQFPAGWKKKAPAYDGDSPQVYAPVIKPGQNWTGLTSRNTGSWDHALTGFVQNELTSMITSKDSGVAAGQQWTVQHVREDPTTYGRQPVLTVRQTNRPSDFSYWVGQIGVSIKLSSDTTQSENAIYGDGTDLNGQVWRNAIISNDGSRTDYAPLAASSDAYPLPGLDKWKGGFVSEAYTKFGTGFSQTEAQSVAAEQLARDKDPGWSGTITLTVDPSVDMPRLLIRSGMSMTLKGFMGTGDKGMLFHIAAVSHSSMTTTELTVDTRFRDLLTVAESIARNRDPLTPTRMLQVNKTSVLVEDIQAPWDYSAGSGYIPRKSTAFYAKKPASTVFPYSSWTKKYPPSRYPSYYIQVNANAGATKGRWTQRAVPILTSEKGTIARTEMFVCDAAGNLLKIPFHLSFYRASVTVLDMPRQGSTISPYIDGAFESVNPKTGQQWDAGNFLAPNDLFIIGWGNKANGQFQRAGFSPGSEAAGGKATGLFFDDSNWTFDNTSNSDYLLYAQPGKEPASAISLYLMLYAEYTKPVFFGGRLFRQNPGQG